MIRPAISRSFTVVLVLGVLGALVPATAASASPPASPTPRSGLAMAYDAARGEVELFGGSNRHALGDTWTWDGTSWTKRTPAHAPAPRSDMGMVYDAANEEVVLFGGHGNRSGSFLDDTWTWDGTDWTKRTPVHSPSPRDQVQMAYDSARGQVVLFGGYNGEHGATFLGDTWTWDGTDWTKRSPAHSPPALFGAGFADDAALGQVVLFGGGATEFLDDTWTWDGTDWTKRSPTHSPPVRTNPGMVNDASEGRVVLFGGVGSELLGDTWTWDGTDWTQRFPLHAPSARFHVGMTYDAGTGNVVLFGGCCASEHAGDTWTWDGADWTQHPAGSISATPGSGPPGTVVQVTVWAFAAGERVSLKFVDSTLGITILRKGRTDASGAFTTEVTIPATATPGRQHLKAKGLTSRQTAKQGFTVT